MAAATAIQVTSQGALAVRVEGSAKKAKIVRAAELEFELPAATADGVAPSPDDIFESKAAQLKSWLKKSKLSGGRVALCVDSSHVILRDLRVSFTDRRQIDKVIAFQVEGVIPSTPIESLAVGYTVLETDDEGSRLLVAAAHREPLREQLELLEDLGIEPEVADSTVGGAMALRALNPTLANAPTPTLWIDLQGDSAVVAVLDGTAMLAIRSVRIPRAAAIELAAAVVADTDDRPASGRRAAVPEPSEDGEAEAGFDADGDVAIIEEEPEVQAAPAPLAKATSTGTGSKLNVPAPASGALVHLLVIEARRSILSAQAKGAIERVVISGVPDSMRAAIAPVKRELGVKEFEVISLLDPLLVKDKLGKPKVKLPSSLGVPAAAGVACKLLGNDASGVDFLVGDLSPTDAFDQIKSPMAIAATLLFMVAGIMLMLVINENRKLEREAQSELANQELDRALAATYEKAPEARRKSVPEAGHTFEGVNSAHDLLTADIAAIKAGNKKLFPPTYDADLALDAILRAINQSVGETMPDGKKNLVHFWLKSINFSQEPARGTSGTTGRVEIQCYLEVEPERKRFELRDALQELKVKNPNFDGITDKQQYVNLFSRVELSNDPAKVFDRGQRKSGKDTVNIRMGLHTFTCELQELRKAVAAGPAGGGRRR